jgi:Mrp family chromosome partitioning ATPase
MAMVRGDHLVAVLQPDREVVDGFLRLAVRLLIARERAAVRTVAVLALDDVDGRTSTALNLAACLGRSHGSGRVLLVDADPRRRTLTRLLQAEGRGPDRVSPTPFERVDLLPALDDGGREAICSPERWREVLAPFDGRYAHVVMDGPPLLTDPHAISVQEAADGVVLVIRSGGATKRTLERVAGRGKTPVLGVVLADGRARGRGRR